jgi:hypothetical protein
MGGVRSPLRERNTTSSSHRTPSTTERSADSIKYTDNRHYGELEKPLRSQRRLAISRIRQKLKGRLPQTPLPCPRTTPVRQWRPKRSLEYIPTTGLILHDECLMDRCVGALPIDDTARRYSDSRYSSENEGPASPRRQLPPPTCGPHSLIQ